MNPSVETDVPVRADFITEPKNVVSQHKPRPAGRRPWGLHWRSSVSFITFAVGLGIFVDILIYSLIVPVVPFRLQDLGYEGVSGLSGWLLFAYSTAIVISTPPIAYLTELYKNRRIPLLLGQVALIAAQVMFMEAPKYWVMVLARIAQGVSASVIWVVGLALVCDTVPETIVGKQMGIVMVGASLGFLVGPPVAGALNDRFGFRGPFVFGIAVTVVELMCRMLIIERKEAVRWDASLATLVRRSSRSSTASGVRGRAYGSTTLSEKREEPTTVTATGADVEAGTGAQVTLRDVYPPQTAASAVQEHEPPRLSILRLLLILLKSRRTMTPIVLTFAYALVLTSQEPVLPLYLEAVYGFDTAKVGLVYIGAVVPSFVSSPLSGWYADKKGALAATLVFMIGSVPFFILVILKEPVAYFLVMFSFMNCFFYGMLSPVMAELAAVTQNLEGVGYGHSYGAFNVAYGLGSAIGPVVGGQLYDKFTIQPIANGRIAKGWMIVNLFDAAAVIACIIYSLFFFGIDPPARRALRSPYKKHAKPSDLPHGGVSEA